MNRKYWNSDHFIRGRLVDHACTRHSYKHANGGS